MMPVADGGDLLMDIGCVLISLCLQRGDFADHDSWQSIMNGTENQLRFKPDRLEKHFFHAGAPGGYNIQSYKPLTDGGVRYMLRKLCDILGFGGEFACLTSEALKARVLITVIIGPEKANTIYNFRRAAATIIHAIAGQDDARLVLHHKSGTDTLTTHYTANMRRRDMTAMQLQGAVVNVEGLDDRDAPALFRYGRFRTRRWPLTAIASLV